MIASATDFIRRYDATLIADLAGDAGTPVDPALSPRVEAALAGAWGEVLAAARLGGRYSENELAELSGADAEFAKDIVCGLALLRIVATRIQSIGEAAHRTLREQADKVLEDLRSGRLIFGTPAAARAQTPGADGPSALDYERLNLLPDRVRNYYPARAERLPLGR